ncbi:5'-AMP-activated protein kinase subunit beta-1-like isoform X2 [Anoplophora glabripennis]|uniref:5'-AMP-activated protein kinase subunit beta-1-like n=1 Tax=Anoplophora glabripennis TaxID=217634 RepID=UPI0008757A3F|nr:5'-AMP-activated protein kinase subunit beta-1-like [Anoplophora glabripennis]XP_023312413.1 5'-AMP-activated protein kinase subunit beta-1-like isoform X2 [Anoplophora glabripennis]
MGNAGSSVVHRERQKSSDTAPSSPSKEGQAFIFDRKSESRIQPQGSHEDEVPYFTKPPVAYEPSRPRANTVSEGSQLRNATESKTPTVFRWEGGGRNVYISGTFTNWQTIPMVKSHGDFVTIIDLPEGEHKYKYYVDGEWKNDPTSKIVDEDGEKKNLITVKQSDFEVFQALAKDSESHKDDSQKEFGQEVPINKPWEKTSGPPILPPHLLQVILNKDTPLSCEPTLLPEPNHVMLNHLYALSIKDGVMVLSATHRYRKKYVTTLLYKPI